MTTTSYTPRVGMATTQLLDPKGTVIFICDIQTRFKSAIHGFDHIVATANKMLKIAKIFEIPVVATEQNPKALGATVPELDFAALGPLFLGAVEKTRFSMLTDDVKSILQQRNFTTVVLLGIESHICVLQSTLDLLSNNYNVYVIADGVSSCNREEVSLALAHMQHAGAVVTTSESAAFQLQRDSSLTTFKPFASTVKEEKGNTSQALQALFPNSVRPYL